MNIKQIFGFIAVIASLSIPSITRAESIQEAFLKLNGYSIWPIANVTHDEIESTFGPRIKPSTNAYDWHRGIDIDAPLGAPVLAAASGTLWNVTEYEDGGTTVVIKHEFPTPVTFHGKNITYFYTLYMHLDLVEPWLLTANSKFEHPSIPSGTKVGTVGHSGKGAIGDHLHFEIRAGTQCSLEYQLEHPNYSCAQGFGFDPHIHPMFLFPNASPNFNLQIDKYPSAQTTGEIEISFPDEEPILNSVNLKITSQPGNAQVYEKMLDLNLRSGYDPTTNAALDKVDSQVPHIYPNVFNISSAIFSTKLLIPASVAAAYPLVNHTYTVTVRTIWNDERVLNVAAVSNNDAWTPPSYSPNQTSASATDAPAQSSPPVCEFTSGILVKLPDDGNPATQSDSTVYYYGKDCKRRAFPSGSVYFSWYSDFSAVQTVTIATMAQMPLGKDVTHKPGATLVKFETDPKVYAIDATGNLRWIQTETLAQSIYGASWNKNIFGLSDASYGLYQFGQAIASTQDYNPNAISNEALTID